ncbi:MAG: S41 family peptidase [Chitinophagaceae bacterium]
MHLTKCLLAILLICRFPQSGAQTNWAMKDPLNPAFILTTQIDGDSVTGFTRKGALVDYVGEAKLNLYKMAAGLKYAEIVHFTGQFKPGSSTSFEGTWNYLFTENSFRAVVSKDSLIITLLDKESQTVRIVRGAKAGPDMGYNYTPVIKNILSLTEKYLYDTVFLASKDWQNFRERLTANAPLIPDDMEMQVGFFAIAREFPFSHYSQQVTDAGREKPAANFILSEPAPGTCLLRVRAFEGSRQAIDTVIGRIAAGGYTTLIIDLRDNGGGTHETALPLIAFLSPRPVYGGFFPNRKWYEQFKRPPSDSDYHYFNEFRAGSLDDFYRDAERGYGLYVNVIPSAKHFSGRVYVLTNQRTASTAEIFALGLKENKLAILAGKKTAGAALSGKKFSVDQRFSVMIPVSDYVSPLGYRIDKRGIVPDIKINSGDELEYLLKQVAAGTGN